MSKRFLYTITFILVVALGTAVAVFLAKGYRFSSKTGTLAGTGIISITSIPDQASVYIDGHLTTATNTNINSLIPKEYDVKIVKDGLIPWEKKVIVKEGLITDIKATLFPAIPTVYPLTFNSLTNLNLSPDGQRMVYVVPESAEVGSSTPSIKKSGIWVWDMTSSNPIAFATGREPHRVADLISGVDYTKAVFRFSPDDSQILITLPDQSLLLNENSFNNPPRDITAVLTSTTQAWDQDQKTKDLAKLATIRDTALRTQASSSAVLKYSLDESKILMSSDGKTNFKVADLIGGQTFNLPKFDYYSWLPDSRHLIVVESLGKATSAQTFPQGKISIIEFDGSNKSEMYVGNFDPASVFSWPDQSRMVIISSVPTSTGNIPNLFGINLK